MKTYFILICSLLGLGLSGCSTVSVVSTPANAQVFIDGKDTGKVTPTGLRVHALPSGQRRVELRKEGYLPYHQDLRVRVNPGKILMSWFPPALLKFGIGDHWKTASPGRIRPILTLESPPEEKKNPTKERPSSTLLAKKESKGVSPEEGIHQKLKALKELHDQGYLTEEEYEAHRQAIVKTINPSVHAEKKSSSKFSSTDFKIITYQFSAETGVGTITVDMDGKGFDARLWVVKNIGVICSSKNILLDSGGETFDGARYVILDESLQDGLFTVTFRAVY